jgi:hypothetical protein
MTVALFFFTNRNFTVHPIDETLLSKHFEDPGQTGNESDLPSFLTYQGI